MCENKLVDYYAKEIDRSFVHFGANPEIYEHERWGWLSSQAKIKVVFISAHCGESWVTLTFEYGPLCPLSPERRLNLIAHSLTLTFDLIDQKFQQMILYGTTA